MGPCACPDGPAGRVVAGGRGVAGGPCTVGTVKGAGAGGLGVTVCPCAVG